MITIYGLQPLLLFKWNMNDIDGILKFFEFTLTTQCRLSAGGRETLPIWFLPLENLNRVQGLGSLFINWIYVILCCSNILLVYSLEKYIYRCTFYETLYKIVAYICLITGGNCSGDRLYTQPQAVGFWVYSIWIF